MDKIVVCGAGGYLVADLPRQRTYHWIYQQMAPRSPQRAAVAQGVQ